MNEVFKALCSDWQLRDGETNDHSDAAYDEACIKRLGVLDDEAQPICHAFAEVAKRFDGYAGASPAAAQRWSPVTHGCSRA